MRTLPTLTLILLSGALSSHIHDRLSLNWEIQPLSIDTVRPYFLWDFRGSEKTEDSPGACYMLYGDSLLSETIDSHRRWYAISSDTLMLVREESFGYSYLPDTIICTSSFSNASNRIFTYYRSRGEEAHSSISVREGLYMSYPGVPGRMLTPSGDTLNVSVTVEMCDYMSHLLNYRPTDNLFYQSDSIENKYIDPASKPIKVVYRRYRWFDQNILPVAVQTELYTTDERGELSVTEKSAYTIDFDPYLNDSYEAPDSRGITDNPLAELNVEVNSGRIVIKPGDNPVLLTQKFEIDIVSAGGIPYYSKIHEYNGEPIIIPSHAFTYGRYIIGIRYKAFVEKRMINIE